MSATELEFPPRCAYCEASMARPGVYSCVYQCGTHAFAYSDKVVWRESEGCGRRVRASVPTVFADFIDGLAMP